MYLGTYVKRIMNPNKRSNMIKILNLPNNYNIEMLKSLDIAYFQNKSKWLYISPVGNNKKLRPLGYELYATIMTYIIPERPFEFSVFINEKMTDTEIQEEIRQFKELTDGYKYIVI